jgi:hypothetical protein
MPTAYYSEHVTLGGVMLGSRALECFDFEELLAVAPKRGKDFTVPGTAGQTARDRVEDALAAVIRIRINGRYDQNNARVARGSWRSNFYSLLGTLEAVLVVNTTQTVQLTRPGGGPHSASAIVADVRGPKHHTPEIAELAVVLKLPSGALL